MVNSTTQSTAVRMPPRLKVGCAADIRPVVNRIAYGVHVSCVGVVHVLGHWPSCKQSLGSCTSATDFDASGLGGVAFRLIAERANRHI